MRSIIRNARAADIPGIVLLLEEHYANTGYARAGLARIDVSFTKQLLVQSIQRHNFSYEGGCWAQVAENDGVIVGFILGTLARVYVIGDRLMASDLLWTVNRSASAVDAALLMKGMIDWAQRAPDCIEIMLGTTDILGDRQRGGIILQRLGFATYGNIYRMELRSDVQCLAS